MGRAENVQIDSCPYGIRLPFPSFPSALPSWSALEVLGLPSTGQSISRSGMSSNFPGSFPGFTKKKSLSPPISKSNQLNDTNVQKMT